MIDLENPSYILIPGAGGMAWYWHRVVALLEQARREVIAVDLPGDDESAGLDNYAEIVVREIGQRTNVTLVAQSLGAFTAAVVCERISVGKLIFVNAMIVARLTARSRNRFNICSISSPKSARAIRVLDQYAQGRTCCRNGHCPTLQQRTQAKTAKLAESPSLTDLLRPVLRGSGNGLHREERVVHSRQ